MTGSANWGMSRYELSLTIQQRATNLSKPLKQFSLNSWQAIFRNSVNWSQRTQIKIKTSRTQTKKGKNVNREKCGVRWPTMKNLCLMTSKFAIIERYRLLNGNNRSWIWKQSQSDAEDKSNPIPVVSHNVKTVRKQWLLSESLLTRSDIF